MGAVTDRVARRCGGAPSGLVTLLAVLCHGTANPALPPAPTVSAQSPASLPSGTPESEDKPALRWLLPPVRIGGTVTYGLRRNIFEDQTRTQSGLSTTLNASTNTYIWQPWFAQVNGGLGFTTSTDSSDGTNTVASRSKSVIVTGNGQLSVLSQSKFPFEAYFQRSDNRVSADLALANSYASQRYGFTQRYYRPAGDATLGWNRSSQSSVDAGRDVQDSLQLRLSHRLEKHNLQFNGDRNTNKHQESGERAVQNNLALQHSYTPDPSFSVQSLANISRSDYRLLQGSNDTRLLQLSSNAFWRPQGQPMTVTGGVRMFALEADSSGLAVNANAVGARLLNANATLGVNYEFNRFTRINAAANLNMTDSRGEKHSSNNQSVGVSYQPDAIALGAFRYNWSTSASGSNSSGGDDAQRQLTLQLSHSLGRSYKLAGGSTIVVDASQGAAVTASSSAVPNSDPVASQRLTHGGSVSWDLPHDAGSVLMRLSASDSRALDGPQDFFQLINFQASSNLPTGGHSSWIGNLTLQATRQGRKQGLDQGQPDKGFVLGSSGSISYQNNRLLGYRRLRFTSDLRLSSDALLPLFGSARDQELAAWDNRLDYSIGRTQLRFNFQVSSSSSPHKSTDPATGLESTQRVNKTNKSIMFSVMRSFGDM